jgi:Bacterial SH3 domain
MSKGIHRPWTRRAVVVGLSALAGVATALVVATPPAAAAGTYSTTATVNVRSGPGTGYSIIGSAPNGATFTLLCQWQGGTNVNGNATWDKVTFSNGLTGAISDYYTTTPSWNSYAPNTGPCGGTPSSREQRAMDWARSVLGNAYTNGDLGDSNHPWNGWCDNFVAHAYGLAASGYATAIAHYNARNSQGQIHTTGTPPSGALVFFAAAAINGYAGHVMLSEGNGNYITTASVISRVSLSWPGAPYLGWAYADANWPGR